MESVEEVKFIWSLSEADWYLNLLLVSNTDYSPDGDISAKLAS